MRYNNSRCVRVCLTSSYMHTYFAFLVSYSQFLITIFLSPVHTNQQIRCCGNDGFPLTPRYIHPSCMPITVPYDDPFYKEKYVSCMEYTRSVTTYRGDCTFGAAEQVRDYFIFFFLFLLWKCQVVLSVTCFRDNKSLSCLAWNSWINFQLSTSFSH